MDSNNRQGDQEIPRSTDQSRSEGENETRSNFEFLKKFILF